MTTPLDLIGEIVTALGIVGTAGSTISWLYERHSRQKLELADKRRIWTDISKLRGLMADLEKVDDERFDAGKLQAIGKLSIMLRDLICAACLKEPRLNVAMIQTWRRAGKLASDWQEQMALNMLVGDELVPRDVESLPKTYAIWDELPKSHPAYAGTWQQREPQSEAPSNEGPTA